MKKKIEAVGAWIKKYNNCLFNAALIIGYAVLVACGAWHHEPWRDEAQSWLLVRDLDFFSLLKQLSYEGTPGLWHLLLFPLAKLGCPYYSQAIVHLIIAVAFVSVLVIYSPFSKITKLLVIFSYYFAYEYAVVARNYSLSVLLLFIIAAVYASRFKKPVLYGALIALLLNTNVHSIFAALALLLLWLYEIIKEKKYNRYVFIGLSLIVLGGWLALWQLLPTADNGVNSLPIIKEPLNFFAALQQSLFPGLSSSVILASFAFVLFLIIVLTLSGQASFFFLISAGWLFYLFIYKFVSFPRHHAFLLIFLIFSLWISHNHQSFFRSIIKDDRLKKMLLIILDFCLLLSCFYCLKIYYHDYKYDFSASQKMASYIKTNGYDKKIIVGYNAPEVSALLPYLPGIKFWYPEYENFGTYVTWNKRYFSHNQLSGSQVIKIVKNDFFNNKDILLLLNKPISADLKDQLELIHYEANNPFWNGGADDESYWLYQLKQS